MSHQVKSIDFASRFQCFFLFVLCKSVIFAFFIARNISNWGTADLNRSKRIARMEGHRVQCKADLNCAYRARQMGCVPLSNGMQSLMAKQENRIGL